MEPSSINLDLIDISSITGTVFQNSVFDGYTEGEFDVPQENGVRNGKGTQKFHKDNEEYTLECTWENGKKNGEGVLLDPNGIMSMKLNFKDDVVEGEGSIFSNGQVIFKGEWKEGKRCGHCYEYDGGHLIYDGAYENDVRNGFGIEYNSANEIEFEGEWVNGNRGLKSIVINKKGKKQLVETYENGKDRYIGGYKEGTVMREGMGTEFDQEGKPVFVAVYKDNCVERKVKEFKGKEIVIYNEDGTKRYEGEYLDKKEAGYPAQGQGKLFKEGVMIYKGQFKNGVREGEGCSYYSNHILMYDGEWRNDMANGYGKFNNSEGIMVVEGHFENNLYTDSDICVHVDSGKIEHVKKMRGCFC